MGFYDVYHGANEMVKELCIELVRMSDEHMAEVREAKRMSDEHMAEVREAKTDFDSMTDEELLEHGLVRMPKDADGKPIRIGDVMEGVDKYDSLKKVMGKVITVSFEADGLVDVAVQAWNGDGKSWHRAYLDPDASVYHHYHAPTVEDVLREFGDEVWNRCCEGATASDSGIDELVAECAAKLRLAKEGE